MPQVAPTPLPKVTQQSISQSQQPTIMLRGAVILGVAASACAFSSVFPASSTMVPRRSTTATRSLRTSVKMMDIDAGQVLAAAPGFVALGALLGKQGTESGNGMVCKCA